MIPNWLKQWRKQVSGSGKPFHRSYKARHLGLKVEALEPRTLPSFIFGGSLATGMAPGSVAIADFNGDGQPDLVTANYGSNNVSVFLGNSSDSFQTAQNFATDMKPVGVAVGDFNADGFADLAVVNKGQGLSILLGNGDGTFKAAQNYFLTGFPASVTVADVNGDGKADLLVPYNYGSSVAVLLGNGNGTFVLPPATVSAGSNPQFVAIGDVNGDRFPDLVVANQGSNNISVLLGNGNGTFKPAANFNAHLAPSSVALADVNRDGKLDVIVANKGSNDVSILLDNGNGTFGAAQNFAVGGGPTSLAVGDVNDVGIPALVVADSVSNTVTVLAGNGDSTFAPSQDFAAVGNGSSSVALADFNGDGLPDIVVANKKSNNVTVLLNNSAPPFQPVQNANTGAFPHAVAVADVNGDGLPDLLVVNALSKTVNVLLGQGTGLFQAGQNYPLGATPYDVVVADINGDGHPDLLVTNEGGFGGGAGTVNVFLGNGNGTFQALPSQSAGAGASGLAVADLNGDKILDLVVTNAFDGTLSLFKGNGDGTFAALTSISPGVSLPYAVAVADMNSDGVPDLVVTGVNTVSVLLGNGNGTFKSPQTLTLPNTVSLRSLAVADFNGDGKLDAAVADLSKGVIVLLGNGNGTFGRIQEFAAGLVPISVAAADVNGDGRTDLVVTNLKSNNLSVLLGAGDGTFQAAENFAVGMEPFSGIAVDVNGDGRPDLLAANSYSDTVSVLLHNFTTHFQIPAPSLATAGNSFNITVTAEDPANKVDVRYTGTVTLSSSDGQFAPPMAHHFTLSDMGSFTFNVTLKTAGLQTISVSDGTSAGTSNPITVKPAAASKLMFQQQPQASVVGAPIPSLSVQLLDSSTNLTSSSASVSMTITSGPAGGTFTGGSITTVAAANGVATFSNLAFTVAGTYTITASSAGLTSVTSAAFLIDPANKRVWTGGGGSNPNWSLGVNWLENIAPTGGNDLFFPDGVANFTPNNDLASATTFNSINFTGVKGGYDLLGNGLTLNAGITGNAGVDKVDLNSIALGASQTFQAANSALTISSAVVLHGFTLTLDGSLAATGNDSLTGLISGSGAIIKNGIGQWLVTGTNIFTGPITINAGTLAVNNSSSLGSASNTVAVNPGGAGTGSLQVFNNISIAQSLTINGNGNNASPGAIDIRDTVGNDTFNAINLGSAAAILSANIGVNTMTLMGAIQNNGFDLSIVGGGGYTTILSGTATISGNGRVLNFGSIFSGTGTLNSVLNINQGTLSPGAGGMPGTLNAADVNFGIGTNFNPILANSGTSMLASTGSVNLAGSNLSLSLQNGFMPMPGQSYVLITATGPINGTFNGLPDGAPLTVNGQNFLIRYINSSSSSLSPSAIKGRTVIFPVPAATSTSLFASPNPVVAGSNETLTAIVTSPAAAVSGISASVITGSVTFFDMGQMLGSSPVVGGTAVFKTTSLAAGNHSITASFGGGLPLFANSNTNATPISLVVNSGSVGWHNVLTGKFTSGKQADIAGMDARGRWWLAVSNGSTVSNQMWGAWDSTINWVNVQTGDFNGDGLTDIVGRNSKTGEWNVALSTGSSFTTSVWGSWSTAVTWVDVHAGDFTGDGKSDLVGRVQPTGRWWVASSLGSSFTNSVWDTWPTAVTWVDVKVGDFNGDGKADLTGRVLQTGWWWTDISMGSSFTSSRWVQWDTSATWVDVQVGDFSGDGQADITGRRMQDGSWFTGLSNSTSFQTPTIWSQWPTTVTWVDVKVGDFNGDGKADLTGRVLQTGRWWVALSNGSTAFTSSPWGTWSTAISWVDVNVGEFNGDGLPDLVGRDPQTGKWYASLATSTSFSTPQLWTTWAV